MVWCAEYLGCNIRTCSRPLQTKAASGPVSKGPSIMKQEWITRHVMDDSVGMGALVEGVSNDAYLEYDAEVLSGVFCTGAND